MRMKTFKPSCNLATIRDGRGAIFSFVPDAPIMEWTHQFIKAGKIRGNHCHPEFDEYILLVDGAGVEVEVDVETREENFIYMNKGECIFIPRHLPCLSGYNRLSVRFFPHQAVGRLPEPDYSRKFRYGRR